MARRKRVQVGWYCDHEDEKRTEPYAGSHLSFSGRWRRRKWEDTYAEPNTIRALTFLDHRDAKKRPHCPRAIPLYVLVDRT